MNFRWMALVCAAAVTAGAHGQDAVQWRVEDGGNGHWYQFDQAVLHWEPHRDRAVARGCHLATITSEAERQFVASILFVQEADIWLGGKTNWPSPITWITGEAFVFVPSYWCPPNGYNPGGGYAIEVCGRDNCSVQFCWNIESETSAGWPGNKAVYEWSADCNGDGIVDYGQILSGELADGNMNGIPDCCESAQGCCPGDITGNGIVNGLDLAAILAAWGTDGQSKFDCDIDNNGVVDGSDLAFVLAGWGACP